MPVINAKSLNWVKIQKADTRFEPTYSVDAEITAKDAKVWNKQFPKQKAKNIDREEYIEKFKREPDGSGDDFYYITVKKKAVYDKDGVETPIPAKFRPRVLVKGEGGKLRDETSTTLVGNGSKGAVQYEINTHDKFGTFAHLVAIRVDELVEYSGGNEPNYDELGEVEELEDFEDSLGEEEDKGFSTEDDDDEDDEFDDIPF